ncbi:unnamed protein product [Coccothraustes coccothraustes]
MLSARRESGSCLDVKNEAGTTLAPHTQKMETGSSPKKNTSLGRLSAKASLWRAHRDHQSALCTEKPLLRLRDTKTVAAAYT